MIAYASSSCNCTTTLVLVQQRQSWFTSRSACRASTLCAFPAWVLPGAHKTWVIWNIMKRAVPTFVEPVLRFFEPLRPSRMKRVRARRHAVNHSPRRRRA